MLLQTLDHSQYRSQKVVSRINLWDHKSCKLERDSINNSIPKQALYKKNNNFIIIKRRIKINDIGQ